jgi:hypothetical protein
MPIRTWIIKRIEVFVHKKLGIDRNNGFEDNVNITQLLMPGGSHG